MPGNMLSLMSMAALMAAVAAHPSPECEPCAQVADAELESLTNVNKYLCCDLSCATEPVAGCGIFGLPIVCKACYDGDGTPAYDDDPTDGSPTPTSTEEPATPPTPEPVTPSTPEPATPSTPEPATPSTPEPATPSTPEPVTPSTPEPATPSTPEPATPSTPEPATPSTPEPVVAPQPVADSSDNESMSYNFSPDSDECDACDEASMVLAEMDWEVLEADGYELVCDPTCFEDATMDGCGAFGLPIECRAVLVEEEPAPGPTPIATGGDEGQGGGEDSGEETGEGEGQGGGEDSGEETGEGEGGGETGGNAGGCTPEETAMCADISPAQEEALAMYDNGGKVIVCDPTCNDGVSDPSHCDYFGLGQRCRGCGSCSECVPCP